jgi:hypothetical protein
MTGGTTDHNKIALNFASNLKFALKRKQYDIFMGDIKLSIQNYDEGDKFFYYRSIPQFQQYILISIVFIYL